jgi:hypothetical protein
MHFSLTASLRGRTRHCEGEARSKPGKKHRWIASPFEFAMTNCRFVIASNRYDYKTVTHLSQKYNRSVARFHPLSYDLYIEGEYFSPLNIKAKKNEKEKHLDSLAGKVPGQENPNIPEAHLNRADRIIRKNVFNKL